MSSDGVEPQQLVDFPPGWSNPRPDDRYDLAVLGATRLGVAAAWAGAEQGGRVALFARQLRYDDNRIRWLAGSNFADSSARWRRDLDQQLPLWELLARGIDVFFGNACFASPRSIKIEEATVKFRRAVLAIEPRANAVATGQAMDEASGPRTPAALSRIESLPRRLLVAGDTCEACEIAQAFCRLGSEVHLVTGLEGIVPRMDRRPAERLVERLLAAGVRVHRGWNMTGSSRSGRWTSVRLGRHGQQQELIADAIVDTGFAPPALASLDLVAAGIRCDPFGIQVNRGLRTSNRAIVAIGPAAGQEFCDTSVAIAGRLAAHNAISMRAKSLDPLLLGAIVHTDPQLAQIGLSLPQIDAAGLAADSRWVKLAEGDDFECEGAGVAVLHLSGSGRRLLGASIVGSGAALMAAELAAQLSGGRRPADLADCRLLSVGHERPIRQIVAACRAALV